MANRVTDEMIKLRLACESAKRADDFLLKVLRRHKLDRWSSDCWPTECRVAHGLKIAADEQMHAAFSAHRGKGGA